MDNTIRDNFISLWHKYFADAELPIVFYYSKENNSVPIVKQAQGHNCLAVFLNKVRKGESICFLPESVGCPGGRFYLGFSNSMSENFSTFLSHGEENEVCERYKRTPQQVTAWLKTIQPLPHNGNCLIFKRWDRLDVKDEPEAVIFFAKADVLSGLFTLANYDSVAEAVISPFGAGCSSMVYFPYKEQLQNTKRSVIGMFDPSARICVEKDVVTFAVPMNKFTEMIEQMEESFLVTKTWKNIQKRI